jgi:hypothetical protein
MFELGDESQKNMLKSLNCFRRGFSYAFFVGMAFMQIKSRIHILFYETFDAFLII